jgi:hypothetical protein
MRTVLSALTFTALLGCAHIAKIPKELRSSALHPLKTAQAAVIVPCGADRSTWDLLFGSKDGKYLCLYSKPYSGSVLAEVPAGTPVIVKRATYWNGIDADGYVFDAIVPSFSTTKRVLFDDLNSPELFNVTTMR